MDTLTREPRATTAWAPTVDTASAPTPRPHSAAGPQTPFGSGHVSAVGRKALIGVPVGGTRRPSAPDTHTPTRAALGPTLSLVQRDSLGRRWMRLSTAIAMCLFGMSLMLIPTAALVWTSQGLVDSGQITFGGPAPASHEFSPTTTTVELPLAATNDHKVPVTRTGHRTK